MQKRPRVQAGALVSWALMSGGRLLLGAHRGGVLGLFLPLQMLLVAIEGEKGFPDFPLGDEKKVFRFAVVRRALGVRHVPRTLSRVPSRRKGY
jgi:hypothetical protein